VSEVSFYLSRGSIRQKPSDMTPDQAELQEKLIGIDIDWYIRKWIDESELGESFSEYMGRLNQ